MNKINLINIFKKIKKEKININISLFITGIIFLIFAIDNTENINQSPYFIIPSGVCFAIWMIITQGADKIDHLAYELIEFGFVILVLPLCLDFYLDKNNFNGFSLYLILFYMGLFFCIYYFVSKLNNVIHLVKNILTQVKLKLFKNVESSNRKSIHIIENITTFFVAIGGLTVAIKVIIEAMSQIMAFIK